MPARPATMGRLGWVWSIAWRGFLIEAEHHSPSRQVEIQTDHVDQLFLEVRVGRQFEGVHAPGLEVVVGTDPGDGTLLSFCRSPVQ